jgi:DNA repair protein RadA/Sms
VNVVGGIRLLETASDLSLAASMAGSFLDVPIKAGVVLFGEIGLAGEVRGVSQGSQRIAEAKKLGFKKAIVPKKNADDSGLPKGIEVVGVRNVRELIETLFEKK